MTPPTAAPLNLDAAFDTFHDHWSPRIAAELNGQKVLLAKALGEFDWHHHEHEDELFLVHKGTLHIDFRDRTVTLNPGDMLLIPRGTEHRPRAEEEAHILLFEPVSTRNTGNTRTENTVDTPPHI